MEAMFKKPYIIAEAGCNHKGEMSIARDLIATAALFCKADAIKFQKRCVRELLTPEQYNAPHPNPANSYGKTYGEHREFLEFTADQHRQLKEWCEEFGITYSTSVWDLTSAKEITALNPKFIKIPLINILFIFIISFFVYIIFYLHHFLFISFITIQYYLLIQYCCFFLFFLRFHF